jgi:hypothetical protein
MSDLKDYIFYKHVVERFQIIQKVTIELHMITTYAYDFCIWNNVLNVKKKKQVDLGLAMSLYILNEDMLKSDYDIISRGLDYSKCTNI